MKRGNTFRIDTKRFKEIQDRTKYCSHCGHSIVFQKKTKRIICNYCGYWVYNHKNDEFKDKLIQKKKRLENED